MCNRCWQRCPDRPFEYVGRLATRLTSAPAWLPDFAAYAAARYSPARATRLLAELGHHVSQQPDGSAKVLLEATRQTGRSMGPLARTLAAFLVERGLALPLDETQRLAFGRRQRRIQAAPEPLRAVVADFAEFLLRSRERARRAGTLPRSDRTLELTLSVLRDLGRFLVAERGVTGWEQVDTADLEVFLALRPASRARHLSVLRGFFRWARAGRLTLINPTRPLRSLSQPGFRGRLLEPARQRLLFERWRADRDTHPHECLAGLLALLHGASNQELRGLKIADIDDVRHTIRLGGRPYPVPLDPVSWSALKRCLDHRTAMRTLNPHAIVTKVTAPRDSPASEAYLTHVLDQVEITPRLLRSTRLAELVVTLDPKFVAAAFGMDPEAVVRYLADHVQDLRLVNLNVLNV
jgi:site-specific recombinase XerD